ncbi:MAG: ABC transporter ATP-binding protein [Candidatus Omnitrophota bacterium]|nr:ABC transporter ATP-binding protein [Candidatus Omnitrophota bacterium]
MRHILEVDRVTKDFTPPLSFSKLIKLDFKRGIPVRALEDVSFCLERGKILGVLGPNGAGKTTLLKIIATLLLPNKGAVFFNGSNLEEKIKMSVGLVAEEERSFYWRLTGRQNLEFFAALYGLDRKTAKSRIDELSELFAVDYADKRFDSYSTGMKRRFALMRGLLHNPELLLLDEPTKSLDYATALNLRYFIKEILVKAQSKTVILATHHMDEALNFCDLFMILNKGKLRAMGTLEQLRKQTGNFTATLGEIFVKLTMGS